MRVKRYIADTIPEAIAKVKSDLGRNAMILHTKPFKEGGFLGFFSKKRFEVIAALEENQSENQLKKPAQTTTETTQQSAIAKPVVNPHQNNNQFRPLYQSEDSLSSNEASEIKAELAQMKELIKQVMDSKVPKMINYGREQLASSLEHHQPPLDTGVSNNHSLGSAAVSSGGWREYLRNYGLEEEVVNYLLDHLPESLRNSSINNQDAKTTFLSHCQNLIAGQIVFGEPVLKNNLKKQQVIAIIGPTGVGKTTTIAKLAANFNLFEGKKVGLITVDTYRIAAVEQLKAYGEIINLPVEVIYSPEELTNSLQKLANYDCVLIDTAGRSPYNQEMMEDLARFVKHPAINSVLLTISATTQYRDMSCIIKNFTKIAFTHLIFTKLDETLSLGPIVSLAWQTKRPVSYLTTGQNVPDDIEVAKSERLITKLFKEYSYV